MKIHDIDIWAVVVRGKQVETLMSMGSTSIAKDIRPSSLESGSGTKACVASWFEFLGGLGNPR